MENGLRVLGVLSGRDLDPVLMRRWATTADRVLAADGGADRLREIGLAPHVVIGDLDSVSDEAAAGAGQRVRCPDQEATDCDKLLDLAAKEGHASVTLAGGEGDLPDHVLATLHSAARSSLQVRLAYRRGIGWLLKPGRAQEVRGVLPGQRVSLLPIEPCGGVTLQNVAWPLQGVTLAPTGLTSISNRADHGPVVGSIESGRALLFVEFPPADMPIW